MKIKHFTAPTMTEAMSKIRAELGDEAIIVSSETKDGSVQVTAAIESTQEIDFNSEEQLEISPSLQVYDDIKIRESLEYHDILTDVAGQILAVARQAYNKDSYLGNHQLLSQALKQMYHFTSLLNENQKNKIFMGMPGCGKSTAIAKLATKAKLEKKRTAILSADNVRAGANSQLEAFAKILELDFYICKNARELFNQVQKGKDQYDLQLIDMPGINPYVSTEVEMIEDLIEGIKATKILVADAGRNTLESIETAEIFSQLGAEMILPTHLDMTRRIGSIISSAYCNQLSFCAGSVSSNIAKGLAKITPEALAKLLLTE